MAAQGGDVWTCILCTQRFTDDSAKVLECQFCTLHYCIKCLNKTKKEYETISKSDCMWFCAPCKIRIEKNIVVEKNIEERCKTYLESFEARIQEVEKQLETKCDEDKVKQIVRAETS